MSEARTWGGLTGEERADRRRTQLLDAGLEVFGGRGWSGTTVRDITLAAGLSQRYFYEQFDGRDACFLAVLDRIADEIQEAVRTAVARAGSPQERAQGVLVALVALLTADERKLRVAFVETFATPEFRARRAQLVHGFAELAARLMAAMHPEPGRVDRRSLRLSAHILSGGIAQVLVDVAAGTLDEPADALVERLTELYRLAAEGAPVLPAADG